MAALNALPARQGLEFARLKKLTGATDGNLGAHIETLAKAGYVAVDKAFVGKKPQTTVTATAAGPRRLRPPCRDAAGDHRGVGRQASSIRHSGAPKREPGIRVTCHAIRDPGSPRAVRNDGC